MAFYTFRPVANGLGTDHPIPDLPFVDDSHLPTDPRAIEAIGRKEGGTTWGRQDNIPRSEGWAAFTTDAERTDLAWYVRFHPGYGRSVMLVRDNDASLQHQTFVWDMPTALVFRSGGYWWDGVFWYRPAQIFDSAAERVVARAVPGAITVTAADVLDSTADPSQARILTVAEFEPDAPAPRTRQWLNDLALWAQRRGGGKPLDECVVRLAAPELSGDQLISATEMAQIADIEPSTFRAYTARGEADVPEPQATVSGRNVWSRPVAMDWAEQRKRSWESVEDAVAVDHAGASVATGISELWTRYTNIMFGRLWSRTDFRQRWALRWRTAERVRQVAEDLGWSVAGNLANIVPMEELAFTIKHAILDEIASSQQLDHDTGKTGPVKESWEFHGINFRIAKMLDWLIRHDPTSGQSVIADVIGEAQDRFGVPRHVSINTIETALSLDGKLDEETLREFLNRALPIAE